MPIISFLQLSLAKFYYKVKIHQLFSHLMVWGWNPHRVMLFILIGIILSSFKFLFLLYFFHIKIIARNVLKENQSQFEYWSTNETSRKWILNKSKHEKHQQSKNNKMSKSKRHWKWKFLFKKTSAFIWYLTSCVGKYSQISL